jgi:hypothetical protein
VISLPFRKNWRRGQEIRNQLLWGFYELFSAALTSGWKRRDTATGSRDDGN